MKIVFGGGIVDGRGSMAGNTYSKNRYGAYIRSKVSPVQPGTSKQTLIRERMTGLSKSYGADLSETQRNGWDALAEKSPVVDVFGKPHKLAGNTMFIKVNMTRLLVGDAIMFDAPLDLNVRPINNASIASAFAGNSELELSYVPNLGAGELLVFDVALNISDSIRFVKNLFRFGGTSPDVSPAILNWESELGSIALVEGAVVHVVVKRYNGATGGITSGVSLSKVVDPAP